MPMTSAGPGVRRMSLVPIAWLKAHEEFVDARVREVLENFRRQGAVDFAIVADAKTGTVIDGHHRLEALKRLHAALVPAHLVDYMDPSVAVRNWRENETPVTKEEIIAHAAEGKLFPPKTTRHDLVRVLDPVNVPLAELMDERMPRGF